MTVDAGIQPRRAATFRGAHLEQEIKKPARGRVNTILAIYQISVEYALFCCILQFQPINNLFATCRHQLQGFYIHFLRNLFQARPVRRIYS